MKKTYMLAAALVLAVAAAFFLLRDRHPTSRVDEKPRETTSVNMKAPTFELKDISGNSFSSSGFLGKPTVINFFATWCPPCRDEIPGFVEVFNKFRKDGFELVGIALDTDSKGNLPIFMAQNRIEYRILLGNVETIRAFGGVRSIPTTYFIGKDGVIRNIHVGYIDKDAFEREVRKLM